MSATLHMYVPLHCYSSLHTDQTLLQILVKNHKLQLFIDNSINLPMAYIPLNYHIYATCANYFMCRYETALSVYIPLHELTVINDMTRSTGIHTFQIISICPLTNMHVTLLINFPLHCYCSLHKTQHYCTYQ